MKKIIVILSVILLIVGVTGCGSPSSSEPKVYKQGEEAFISDDSGKQIYSLKINSVKVAENFEYKKDFTSANQIVEVDYTYKYISKEDKGELLIHAVDLKVSDITGAVAECSSMFPKQKPQEITVGTNCTVQGYYGLSNKGDKVKINFSSNTYKKSGVLIFEVPIN